ncbi:MAG: UDP-N-acetylmuramoyl-tripeptide--D-alanyl-D-alanine ligase [Planctomycetaceae bacterium]|nr:UDP-N-acetylmuramoyl-tripeptide--D-alanyl-D-alanine ligase [Planctomycetaceae bacterium]
MASVYRVHSPCLQAIVLATRAEVVRRPTREAAWLTTDTRADLADACFVALRGEQFDGHAFVAAAANGGAVMALVERDLGAADMAALPEGFGVLKVRSTREALGQIAHAWRRSLRTLRVAAVTGSAGKTTTRRLLEGILSEVGPTHASPKSFNNDIGVPLTLLSTSAEAKFLVAEIGMNHPGELLPLTEMAEPEVGIVTLAGRAHLEGLGSVEAVAAEKASLLAGVLPEGVAVVNGDNPPLVAAVRALEDAGRLPTRVVWFGEGPNCHYRLVGRQPIEGGQQVRALCPTLGPEPVEFTLQMAGEHNARNALAALAAATEMGVPFVAVARGLARVEASDMRLERLEIGGRTVFNDAYNANPDAMIASLKAFAELTLGVPRRVVVLGEMRELGPTAAELHAEVGRHAAMHLGAGDALVAVGPHAAALAEAAREAGFSGDSLVAQSFSDAFAAEAAALMPVGASVLLKGSRGARMERFVEPLRSAFAHA